MVVLKGIPAILSPELLHVLAKMGHGDEIVLADANFPSSSICQAGPIEVRADGHGIPALLEAILTLLPLDAYVDSPAILMELVPGDKDKDLPTPVWGKYQEIINKAEGKEKDWTELIVQQVHEEFKSLKWKEEIRMAQVERFAYYERAKKAFAVIATGETALYGNLILKKGVISAGQ